MKPIQEKDVVHERGVIGAAAGIAVAIVIGAMGAWLLGDCRGDELGVDNALAKREVPFYPEAGGIERTWLDERDVRPPPVPPSVSQLGRWGWVDREQGIVHMPVERAIDLYLERQGSAGGGER